MNPIEMIEREIQRAVPTAWIRLRRPRSPEGEWWLDAKKDDHTVTIQWSPRRGFGISASILEDGFGEGPEETFEDRESTAVRALQLLRTKAHTVPPTNVILRDLRALVGLTQEQLAEKLGVQQAAVSRLERRKEITLSSLRRFVAALGAELEINIRTPTGDSLRLTDSSDRKAQRANCVHVEDALSTVELTTSEFPVAECETWLDTFEKSASTRWPLRCGNLALESRCAETLASSEADLGCVVLDFERARRLAREFWRRTSDTPQALGENAFHFVLRHLLAHEVGHFVDEHVLRGEPAFCHFQHRELAADAVAGWLAARAGDDAILGSNLSRYLGCHAIDCTHPRPEERSLAYLTGYVMGAKESDSVPLVTLLVIRVSNLELSRLFYTRLGLDLRPEKHGDGPSHYSCTMAGTVVELYPTKKPSGGARLGLRVPVAAKAMQELLSSGFISKPQRVMGRSSVRDVWVVRDPDQNTVELELTQGATTDEPRRMGGLRVGAGAIDRTSHG